MHTNYRNLKHSRRGRRWNRAGGSRSSALQYQSCSVLHVCFCSPQATGREPAITPHLYLGGSTKTWRKHTFTGDTYRGAGWRRNQLKCHKTASILSLVFSTGCWFMKSHVAFVWAWRRDLVHRSAVWMTAVVQLYTHVAEAACVCVNCEMFHNEIFQTHAELFFFNARLCSQEQMWCFTAALYLLYHLWKLPKRPLKL